MLSRLPKLGGVGKEPYRPLPYCFSPSLCGAGQMSAVREGSDATLVFGNDHQSQSKHCKHSDERNDEAACDTGLGKFAHDYGLARNTGITVVDEPLGEIGRASCRERV